MPYIGHSPTNAGTFYVIDDLTMSSSTTYTLQVGGVSVTPRADNLLITLDGVVQHATDAYTVSGSTLTFASAPGSGVDFYGIIMGQSASHGQGSIGADELSVTGDGTSNQFLSSDADGTMTWKDGALSTMSATGDIIYRNASGVVAKLSIGSTGQLLTVASGLPSWATDSEPYLPLAGGTMSGAINLGSQNVTNGGTITGTFVGGITGNASTATVLATTRAINGVNFDGSAAITVTADANTLSGTTLKSTVVTSSLTSVGTLTGLAVNSPSGHLHVDLQTTATDVQPYINFKNAEDSSVSLEDSLGAIYWFSGSDSLAVIGSNYRNTDGSEACLFFKTQNGADGLAERMRIDEDGNIGIGQTDMTTYASKLYLKETTSNLRLVLHNSTSSTGERWELNSSSGGTFYIGNEALNAITITPAGDATFGGKVITNASTDSVAEFSTSHSTGAYLSVQNSGTSFGYFGSGKALISGSLGNDSLAVRAENTLYLVAGGGGEDVKIEANGNTTFAGNVTTATGISVSNQANQGSKFAGTFTGTANPEDCTNLILQNLSDTDNAYNTLLFKDAQGNDASLVTARHDDHSGNKGSLEFWVRNGGSMFQTLKLGNDGNATFAGDVTIPHKLIHAGDADTYIQFQNDRITHVAGGHEFLDYSPVGQDYLVLGSTADVNVSLRSGSGAINMDGGDGTIAVTGNTTFAGNIKQGSGAHYTKTWTSSGSSPATTIVTFTVTTGNHGSWYPLAWRVMACGTIANASGIGHYEGTWRAMSYAGSISSIGNIQETKSDIEVTCSGSSNVLTVTVTYDVSSAYWNATSRGLVASIDVMNYASIVSIT